LAEFLNDGWEKGDDLIDFGLSVLGGKGEAERAEGAFVGETHGFKDVRR
jgi:hypothetical protein